MGVQITTGEQRPDLLTDGVDSADVWPEYNMHGDVAGACWPRLASDLAGFQLIFYDEDSGTVLAEGHTAPCWWDGSDGGLSDGIDATMLDAFDRLDRGRPVNTVCALAAEIPPLGRGRGLSRTILLAMSELARRHGFAHLIAPVRPSWKERYPLTPIERYIAWRRDDGLLLDPWMRVHERLGARVGPALPRSLRITGSVPDWEAWTGLAFPDSGDYVFPHGLAPVAIDRDTDTGTYWEPNVWIVHTVPDS